ncbi:hypothetical protein EJV47_10080 [Hymenobacter gummosus]|uniref:Toxin-antitoxin system YwqK family antitoxin n=1 Tax=Hymenobacter gummosus TaxID=1776032 RepID=A0A431U336_9BACT|nr:hypothetical protein [Hymenobacter gummosus]RTQ49982.1 hypothetical protein EJV47_10080 [Hymenobacter gummosus]
MNHLFCIRLLLAGTAGLLANCQRECRVVKETYANQQEKVVLLYPDCDNQAHYKQQFFYPNGRLASEGIHENGPQAGRFRSWAENGQQTAAWSVLDGKEHGFIQCWYENGHRKKTGTLNRGVAHGLQRTWYENGRPESAGRLVQGQQEGPWRFWDEDGGWKIRTYRHDVPHGPTTEHLVDSATVTLVSGQYANGKEDGLWQWFDQDSVLYESATYVNGQATGEYREYHANGRVKARGWLVKGLLEGKTTYFDHQGGRLNTVTYRHGNRIP